MELQMSRDEMEAMDSFLEELHQRCRDDAWCRECLAELEVCSPAYEAAVGQLTQEQREEVERYISACEELEHSRIFVAYNLGQEHPRLPLTRELSPLATEGENMS